MGRPELCPGRSQSRVEVEQSGYRGPRGHGNEPRSGSGSRGPEVKRKFPISRLIAVALATGAVANCGQNARSVRGNTGPAQQPPRASITGGDASRNTTTLLRDATPEQCPGGGKIYVRFDDSAGSGQPASGETVRQTTIRCNGTQGQPGYTIISREFDPDQGTCPDGGAGFMQFTTQKGDSIYSPSEGDQLVSPAQTKCASSTGNHVAALGAVFRQATQADCPLSGGKGDVVQYFFNPSGDGKFTPSRGDTLAAEIPACATPKNLAAIQAVTPSVTSEGSCTLYSFTPPAIQGAGAAVGPVTFKSCGNGYGVGFLDTTPTARTCPNGGVMLAFYLDEDHDGLINTTSERASVVDPFPLCFSKAQSPSAIAVTANHVTSLTNQCTQSGGAGTTFTSFVSRDGSGLFKGPTPTSPGDAVVASIDVCDPVDGRSVTGVPPLLPELRAASSDELKFGHCQSGAAAVVTESRLFGNLTQLQGWLRNKSDQNNQGRLLADSNIVCLPLPGSATTAAASPGSSASSGGSGGTGAAATASAPAMAPIIRNATTVLPSAEGQCTDGSAWSIVSFKDHIGNGNYDPNSDGPLTYSGCLNQATANPMTQPVLDGTHTELHLTKIESNADFPQGGYTVSVYDRLTDGQALEGAEHEDFAIINGPGSPATAINLVELNSYRFSDPKKAPKEPCDGVAVVNFYDTVGDGAFTPGKTPVLNEFALCEAQKSGLRVRPTLITDRGCHGAAGVVFESYLDREHAGRFVEGDPITESVPFCPPPSAQPPAQAEQDCAVAENTFEGRVTRLTNEELSQPDLRNGLPYKLKSGKIGLATYGAHLISPLGGTSYLKDTQVLYRVSFGLPSQDSLRSDISVSLALSGTRMMSRMSHPGTDLFCLLDSDATECSGSRYEGAYAKHLNPVFWKDLPDNKGEGKATLENQEFSKRIMDETRLTAENMRAFKHIPRLELGLGELFPELDQGRFLYSAIGNAGTREFLVEIADDIYASRLHFQATAKLPVCRNSAPLKSDAVLAAASNGS